MARFQRGSLRKEFRKDGETWLLRYYTTREADGRRVEHETPVGLVRDFPNASAAWEEVNRQHLYSHINNPGFRGRLSFANLAQSYVKHELGEQGEAVAPKSHTTIAGYRRILRNRCIPRWGKRSALGLEPLEIEEWLKSVKRQEGLKNPTLDKMRRMMSLVYKHGQRYGLIPRDEGSNPIRFVRCKTTSNYEARILNPQQAFAVLMRLQDPERTLTLLAASTGLRISECLGLRWNDVEFADSFINIRRTWTCGRLGVPKSMASQAPVPLHSLLAEFLQEWKKISPYAGSEDWVFPSFKLKGRQPRVGNMLVAKHLRPAAVRAGVLKAGEKLRFGFHNLRHSLASFLVRSKTDPKTVQALLRHSDVRTTLQLYAHSVSEDRLAAQGQMLEAMLKPGSAAVN